MPDNFGGNARWGASGMGGRPNAGRNVIDPEGIKNWNLGVFKNTYITENTYVQFLEMINAFNHRHFTLAGDPKSQVGPFSRITTPPMPLLPTREPQTSSICSPSLADPLAGRHISEGKFWKVDK